MRVGYVDTGSVAGRALLRRMADGDATVAAVNGDFYHYQASFAPLGAAAREGEALKSPTGDRTHVVTIDRDGTGAVRRARFHGTAMLPGPDLAVDQLNSHTIPGDGVGVFTRAWGDHPRDVAVKGADRVTELVVADGTVRAVRDRAGAGRLAEGHTALVGRGAAADRLARLRVGDPVAVDYRLTAGGDRPWLAVGGRNVLVRDGRVTGASDGARASRTAVGFSADGRWMYVLTSDGRIPKTRGATLPQMAERLVAAGADTALELDGGGSSTLLVRDPDSGELTQRNRAGEDERRVPNGLVVRTVGGPPTR